MMWGIIATWRMAKEGCEKAALLLNQNVSAKEAIIEAICDVEDNPYYKSVGYGGLPNEQQVVELDASFMDGDTLSFGAVGAIQDFANPIKIAAKLSEEDVNCFLVGRGASEYAKRYHFEEKCMLSDRASAYYRKRIKEMNQELIPYNGHDTVGMVNLDTRGSMCAATSTSGLFMKKSGRLGDSPIIGSGFYVDSEVGGASTTGLGEDLMKGCISYEVVRKMSQGKLPQAACEEAIVELQEKLIKRRGKVGDLSIVAMNRQGEWGGASTLEQFSFVVATKKEPLQVYLCQRTNGKFSHEVASDAWLEEYMSSRMRPIEE